MKVRVSETAKRQIDEAARHYRNIHPPLALRLIAEFEAVAGFVADFPALYRRVTQDVRTASLASFPYEIYYRTADGEVQILLLLPARIAPETKSEHLQPSQE